MPLCTNCKQDLPEDAFWKKGDSNKREYHCKQCRKTANIAWRAANKDRVRAKQREYDRKTAEKRNALRRQKRAAMTPEQVEKEKQRQKDSIARTKQRRIAEYLEEHGQPPLCECGCGKTVNFGGNGRPNKYINGHKINFDDMLDIQYENHYIPLERLRDALNKVRQENDWTVKELAERAGISYSHMRSILYDKKQFRRYGFEAVWVENLFKRIKGLPAPPTSYMIKQYKHIEKKHKKIEDEFAI